ncbi:poly [ADP-ribose] polymerase isoform X2 [Nasonia vitripennis]|uniref:Poly [ADP-ribose] polymerase n=1 Tax=Nasonia vitripennis TaxID=7425 RepID=A0A7M7G5F4_NASVI|nr:poly [ADP-ribose] polymerase isoform X2 [Nasonia vitripennis]
MTDDLPFRVEYSKTGRAGCKVCKSPIAKESLRIATVVQSPFHDGKMVKWHHANCFFQKQRPKTTGEIAHFDSIRWEDQEAIRKQIEEPESGGSSSVIVSSPTETDAKDENKNLKRAATDITASPYSEFKVEYAKSSRSTCKGCGMAIMIHTTRLSKKDFESKEARRFGGLERWHHLDCFDKLRKEFQFFDVGTNIPGADTLTKEDKEDLEKYLPKIDDEPLAKKPKLEPVDVELEKKLKKQSEEMFDVRDQLSKLGKKILARLLEANGQTVPTGNSEILDALADVMYFGALEPCPKCGGQFEYKSGTGYKCTGNVSEWAACENLTDDPVRREFVVPEDLIVDNQFLSSHKCEVKRRLLKTPIVVPEPNEIKTEDVPDGPKITDKPAVFKNMTFVHFGSRHYKVQMRKAILALGGTCKTNVDENTTALLSSPHAVRCNGPNVQTAKSLNVHVVSEEILEEAKNYTGDPIELIKKHSLVPWGGDISSRISKSIASNSKSASVKPSSGMVKQRVKGGGAVDLDSGLQDYAHVYHRGNGEKFTVTMGITDIQTQKNSFYKMQIYKHDRENSFWLFRSWGRIGTIVGGKKCEKNSLDACIKEFESLYKEKTGNSWSERDSFVKMPNKMHPIDIDHGVDETVEKILESNVESKLNKPVQDLMRLIFDVESMKRAMLEYEIDMDKMPLGKISKKQIQEAYSVLTELLALINNDDNPEQSQLIAASNKFYTLIPHSFGLEGPKIIKTEKEIQAKCEMLDTLLEMEIAQEIMRNKKSESTDKNRLDAQYAKLNTDIEPIDKDSDDFKLIEQYVKNTHAHTHWSYELIVEDVFKVKRSGEESRFKPFEKLHNRKLLWHGSRVTNFGGILSQGLRIAPPEAPINGYMFGKGIYFADMVSKSANYCCTNKIDSTGLLLLCDVALGNTYERYSGDCIQKLPNDKHSTWGRGCSMPDPEKSVKLGNGVEVPCGPSIEVKSEKIPSLLYNEFIVYDVAQVKIEYLVRLNFNYKY